MDRLAETTLREAWRLAPQLALIRCGERDPSVKGWIGSEPPTYRLECLSQRPLPRFAPSQKNGPNAGASEGRLGPKSSAMSNPTLMPFETDGGPVTDLGETAH
jgi:hypothetical protein